MTVKIENDHTISCVMPCGEKVRLIRNGSSFDIYVDGGEGVKDSTVFKYSGYNSSLGYLSTLFAEAHEQWWEEQETSVGGTIARLLGEV